MKKKIFGIKISTVVQFILCLLLAFAIWLCVQYANIFSAGEQSGVPDETNETSCAIEVDLRLQ